jgi:hypothetical protein
MGLEAITLWLRVQKLAKPAFDGLLDTVSNRILSLALELREQLGTVDDKTEKLEPAGVDRSIVYHIYGGNDVIAANGGNESGLSYPYSSLCVVWLNTTTGVSPQQIAVFVCLRGATTPTPPATPSPPSDRACRTLP